MVPDWFSWLEKGMHKWRGRSEQKKIHMCVWWARMVWAGVCERVTDLDKEKKSVRNGADGAGGLDAGVRESCARASGRF
jgi:hypothetical protein